MKKSLILTVLGLGVASVTFSQERYFTRDGHVEFFSSTPVEDIAATNDKMTVVIDFETGTFETAVLIKSFEFEKALMEEHFNENYMESNDFPKATFSGTIEDFAGVRNSDFPPGVEMAAKGKMTIHGVTKEVTFPVVMTKSGEKYSVKSNFMVSPADYDIEIPGTVRDNIAKEIKVSVDATLAALKK